MFPGKGLRIYRVFKIIIFMWKHLYKPISSLARHLQSLLSSALKNFLTSIERGNGRTKGGWLLRQLRSTRCKHVCTEMLPLVIWIGTISIWCVCAFFRLWFPQASGTIMLPCSRWGVHREGREGVEGGGRDLSDGGEYGEKFLTTPPALYAYVTMPLCRYFQGGIS